MSVFRNSEGIPRLWPAISFLIAALIIVAWATWHARQTLDTVTALTERQQYASSSRLYLEQTLSLVKDMETGARGFVITGDDSFLAPYREAADELPSARAHLMERLRADEAAAATWPELEALMQARLSLLEQTIRGRRERGEAIIHDSALLTAGKVAMDSLRQHFQGIDAAQEARIGELAGAVAEARRLAERWASLTTALSAGLIALAILLLLREHALRQALEARLRRHNAELDAKVGERTADLARARDRIAAFAREQERAIEAERRRLSREVHDQIGQVFTAIKLIVGSVPRDAFPPGQEEALAQALAMGIASTRRVTAELRPPLLDDLGLAAALEHFVASLAKPDTLQGEVAVADTDLLDGEQALTLFRIVQEAVTNVLRHADARQLRISGQREGRRYVLRIADDGRGLAEESRRPGALGIAGMHERARLLGGDCQVVPAPAGGTVVEASLPLHDEESPHEHPAR